MYCPDCSLEMDELHRLGSGTPVVYLTEVVYGCGFCDKTWTEATDSFEGKRTITQDTNPELILGKRMTS